MLAGYSALNFGHCNPVLVAAAERQLGRLTLTSRAFHNDLLGVFGRELAALCGMDAILPMNTGAEAVETAVKMARKWGYQVKGVPEGRATIIVMGGNFHGRTTTIISFSDDPSARAGFGPYTPGFVTVPYGDAAALAEAIDENTVAVLLEPIQGEGGVVIPPDGFLRRGPPAVHRAQRADARGRDPVGPWPDGEDVRLRPRGRRARRVHPGQGAGRRHPAGVRGRGPGRRDGRLPPGRARQHVRRQPARLRGRDRGRPDARDRRAPGAGPGARRRPAGAPGRAARGPRVGGALARPVGRRSTSSAGPGATCARA